MTAPFNLPDTSPIQFGMTLLSRSGRKAEMTRVGTLIVFACVVAGGGIGATATSLFTGGRAPVGRPHELVSIRAAAAILCPDGDTLSVVDRISTGAANAFLSFDQELPHDDRVECGDPVSPDILGRTLATVRVELAQHPHDIDYVAFALEAGAAFEDHLGLTPSNEVGAGGQPEVESFMLAGDFEAAARRIGNDGTGASEWFMGVVVHKGIGTVSDDDAHDSVIAASLDQREALDDGTDAG